MNNWLRRSLLLLFTTTVSLCAKATHILGGDFYYTHVSNNTYKISLVLYGDCSGASFPQLYNAVPEVEIYNNGSLFQTINLSATSLGVEVTPVCPAQVNNTTCNGGTIPGIKQFTYSANVNLGSTSANWLFRFTSSMGGSSSAGRSGLITNVFIPNPGQGGSPMVLEATLNNTTGANSSPIYTTIPTPFFCINKPTQYNPGAVDANNDSLAFNMVPGLQTGGSPVTYIAPYTAAAPLGTAAGTFLFSSNTGQLNFTPNLVQTSLVVGRVDEYKNGVLVGTSMREMTFIVLNNCNNNPPTGNIGSAIGGTVTNSTSIRVCQGQANVSFSISPTDLDGDIIDVVTAGLPPGAIFNVNNNNTTAPVISFSWATGSVAVGSYIFYITYTDNGCPLSSKQTIAYTINIVPKPSFNFVLTQAATCTKKAVFNIVAGAAGPYTISILQGSTTVQTTTNAGQNYTDSLAPGTYTIRLTNANTCLKDSVITIASPPVITAAYTTTPSCSSSGTGTVSSVASGGLAPFQYALGIGAFGNNPTFTGLSAGTYTYRIKDANDCIKDTTLTIANFPAIIPAVTSLANTLCPGQSNGSFTISASAGLSPYTFALGSGGYSSNSTFNNLAAGTYVIHTKDANNCIKDTSVIISSPSAIVPSVPALTNALCNGQASGAFTIAATGGTPSYTYAFNGGTYGNTTSFTNLAAGSYTVSVKDANNCIKDTTISITQPTPLALAVTLTQPLCNGDANGMITVNGSGATAPYTYALGSGAFAGVNLFNNLGIGSYTVHVKDANNCTHDTTVTMTQPAPVQISFTVTDAKCFGEASGSVTITGAGGTPTYTYAANGSPYQASGTFNNLGAGAQTISVRDNNGCTKDTVAIIEQPQPLVFDAVSITNPTCVGFTDGQVTVSVSGGTNPYQYSKDGTNFSSSSIFTALLEGNYKLFARDNNGCTVDTTIVLEGYPDIIIDNITITPATCFGMTDGAVSVSASGGNQPLSYAINNGGAAPAGVFSGLPSANYTVVVTDDKGCTLDSPVYIPAPAVLEIRMDVVNNDCLGADDQGAVTAVVNGGNSPYSYQWSNAQTGATISGLNNGVYAVAVEDDKGCTGTDTAEVGYDDCCTVFVPNAFTPNNDGKNDEVSVLYKGDMELQQLSIYNRFGQRVFYTTDINDKWNGIFAGQAQDIGTYFYYLTVTCGGQKPKTKQFKGDIVLVR